MKVGDHHGHHRDATHRHRSHHGTDNHEQHDSREAGPSEQAVEPGYPTHPEVAFPRGRHVHGHEPVHGAHGHRDTRTAMTSMGLRERRAVS